MIEQAECKHKTLTFGSGDYYIFCDDCQASWIMKGKESDISSVENSNIGVGASLSGEQRSES